MKQFNVYQSPVGGLDAVKQGWSWPGLFFAVLWAFIKNLWAIVLAVLLCLIMFSYGLAEEYFEEGEEVIIEFLLPILTGVPFGLYGNRWREEKMLKKGYQYQGTFLAKNPRDAILQCQTPASHSERTP